MFPKYFAVDDTVCNRVIFIGTKQLNKQ